MKTLSKLINESVNIDVQENSINYIDANSLKQYLDVADKFLSDEAKYIVNWLIEHNDYVEKFGNSKNGNALENFYKRGIPSDPELKQLYKNIGILVKNDRLLEIPVFMTEEQFTNIINRTISPDEILLDLTTERGRTNVVKKYYPLVLKIVKQFAGKSNLDFDELISSGLEGLTNAMNWYGKNYGKKQQELEAKLSDDERKEKDMKRRSYTFAQYAAYIIRMSILYDIENVSKLVRIPKSAQERERAERGANIKNNTTSGEAVVSKDKDGNEKTLFDTIGNSERAEHGVDQSDINFLWNNIHTRLNGEFSKRDLDVFYSFYGINNHKKLQGKELANKYNIGSSTITAILMKIKTWLYKNCNNTLNELNSLYHECLQHKYEEEDDIFIIQNTQEDYED